MSKTTKEFVTKPKFSLEVLQDWESLVEREENELYVCEKAGE